MGVPVASDKSRTVDCKYDRQILDAEDRVINRIQEPLGMYHLHDQDIDWPEEKLMRDASEVILTLTGP